MPEAPLMPTMMRLTVDMGGCSKVSVVAGWRAADSAVAPRWPPLEEAVLEQPDQRDAHRGEDRNRKQRREHERRVETELRREHEIPDAAIAADELADDRADERQR